MLGRPDDDEDELLNFAGTIPRHSQFRFLQIINWVKGNLSREK
jgi:hypothetical protein